MKKTLMIAAFGLTGTSVFAAEKTPETEIHSQFPITIELSCGTLTAEYTPAPEATMESIMSDMAILYYWGEQICSEEQPSELYV
ncbi:hypothetical protein ABDK00_007200 [Niabella insulamsoli]|uniref:hypothetical protein n=1 Tax=Niabella insulamsoli TaxID=3144874 RepID=UPI0031FCFA34